MRKVEIERPGVIWIPAIVKKVVRESSREELKKISSIKGRAKDLIYYMSSQLNDSFRKAVKKEDSIKINLNAEVLKNAVCSNYVPVLNFLIEKGVIERDNSYLEGCYSREYWLTDKAINKGLKKVEIADSQLLNKITMYHDYLYKKATDNIITDYLLNEVYPFFTLPSDKVILEAGKRMVKEKKCNRKGKQYKVRGKKSKSDSLKKREIRYIEDDIEIFNNLTKYGIKVPRSGSYRSGGRVICSLAMSPSWIRKLIKIDGKETVELDFSGLHPCIANQLWGANTSTINHNIVAQKLNIEKTNDFKINHLSFFHKEYDSFIKKSSFAEYYKLNHNELYENMLLIKEGDKKNNNIEKTVTRKLFEKEVELMCRVVEKFKANNVKGLYIYDAMSVKQSDAILAKKLMNEAAAELNILTQVK